MVTGNSKEAGEVIVAMIAVGGLGKEQSDPDE